MGYELIALLTITHYSKIFHITLIKTFIFISELQKFKKIFHKTILYLVKNEYGNNDFVFIHFQIVFLLKISLSLISWVL